jgi:VanZ family protein
LRRLARWWPAIAWAVLISVFSTGAFTSENTSRIIIPILHWLFPRATSDTLFLMHHVIRKCGHFTEYFVLSLLILRGIRAGRQEMRFVWLLAVIALVAGYATLDEFHQSFVPGRGGLELDDVLLDTLGGAAAQAIAALVIFWEHVRKQQRDKRLKTGTPK